MNTAIEMRSIACINNARKSPSDSSFPYHLVTMLRYKYTSESKLPPFPRMHLKGVSFGVVCSMCCRQDVASVSTHAANQFFAETVACRGAAPQLDIQRTSLPLRRKKWWQIHAGKQWWMRTTTAPHAATHGTPPLTRQRRRWQIPQRVS